MKSQPVSRKRVYLVWSAFLLVVIAPIAGAALSPLLAWREPVYVVAGFAGVIAFALLLAQPVLIAGYLPGISLKISKRVHRWVGATLVIFVVVHVAALWLTSPPDVIDALLFSSPTPFSVWGVIAMWALFAAAIVALMRNKFNLQPRQWRRMHTSLTTIVIVGTVAHALLIEGTMETASKALLCIAVVIVGFKSLSDLKVWRLWQFSGRRHR
ncbi:ferric reductase-like transmembrane domain-containing protein [Roseobacter sp.]|uniref:ferric reductase-like transmembrane domain-containing protein n=1 Tax=Roseobacter sp. TaxID=1907202 RepID=UPI00385F23FC